MASGPLGSLGAMLAFSPGGRQSALGEARSYSRDRMYGAAAAFATANRSAFLRRRHPRVLALDGAPSVLDLDLGSISGPESLGPPARAREMGIFNPSLAAAPDGLCPRCAYVAALRVDPLHQCHEASPLLDPKESTEQSAANAWFKGTAIAVLDRRLRTLGWTWLINAPQFQVSQHPQPSRWFVPVGAADSFPPPWAKAVYDVRVVGIRGRLFVSYVCRRCDFSVAHLQLTAVPTADGGLRELRAWQSQRYGSRAAWAQGRNQALFVASAARGLPEELMVQPWLGIVGSFGAPSFGKQKLYCGKGSRSSRPADRQAAGFKTCGATPAGELLDLQVVSNLDGRRLPRRQGPQERRVGFGLLEMLGNTSHDELQRSAVGGVRLSTTSNLVRMQRPGDGGTDGACTLYLGVGHVHRSEGELNKAPSKRRRRRGGGRGRAAAELEAAAVAHDGGGAASPQRGNATTHATPGITPATFMWGFHYTHFFYAVEAHAPFRVVATSGEFCLEAAQDKRDCESIQFVSGLALAPSAPTSGAAAGVGSGRGTNLLMSYGVNDCEAKVGSVGLDRVWSMLEPLAGVAMCPQTQGQAQQG